MLDARAPAPVSLEGTVVTENLVVSPLSGLRAAAVRVRLLERRPQGKNPMTGDPVAFGGEGGAEVFTRVGDVWYGASLLIADADGREIVITTTGLGLRDRGTERAAMPLGTTRPPELTPLLASIPEALVCYRETLVLHGDRVRVQGMAFPAGPRRWETRADVGPVTLHKIGPAPGAKSRIS